MSEVVQFVLAWLVGTSVSFALVIADERRLSEARLERAWPPVSRNAAIFIFGPLAVPIHFVRTRRSIAGVLLGIAALAVVALVSELVGRAFDLLFDLRF